MRIAFWLLLSVLLSTSAPSFSEETGVSQNQIDRISQTDCGVTISRELIAGDGTLCEEDIAFGLLYELFPSIFNEILPIWELSRFGGLSGSTETPNMLGEYRGDQVFFVLFDLFYKLVLVCISTYFIVLILSVVGRYLRGEDVSDPNSGKDTPKSFVVGGLVGGVFLIPFKNFFLGQLLVFSLAIAALSMANFVYSLFLSGNQAIFENVSNYTNASLDLGVKEGPASERVQNRHDYMADNFYRYLANMEFCRVRSSEQILSGIQVQAPDEYLQARKCTMGAPRFGTITQTALANTETPHFIWGSTRAGANENGGDYQYETIDKITFKTKQQTHEICYIGDASNPSAPKEPLPDYSCGEIAINSPDWSRNPLIILLDNPAVLNEYIKNINSAIGPTSSPSDISAVLESQWISLQKVLYEALKEAWTASVEDREDQSLIGVDNEVVRKGAALEQSMMNNARPQFRQASQFLHQEAMNAIMFGNKFSAYDDDGNFVSGYENYTSFMEQMKKAEVLSDLLLDIQCLNAQPTHPGAQLSADFVAGRQEFSAGNMHAKCFDVEDGVVREFNPAYSERDADGNISPARDDRRKELTAQLQLAWAEAVTNLSAQRKAVESSFNKTSMTDGGEEWWVNLRQKGYLSAADYAIGASNVVNNQKRSLKQLVNNFSIEPFNHDEYQISLSLAGKYSNDKLFEKTESGAGEALMATNLPGNKVDSLVSSSEWVVSQEMLIRSQPITSDTVEFYKRIAGTFSLPGTYLDRLGVGLSQGAKNETACLEDPSGCPFPLSDPLIELTLFGHDMLDASIDFFAIALTAKAVVELTPENIGGGTPNTGNVSTSTAGLDKLMKVASNILDARRLFDLIFNIFSSIMTGVFIIGALLAYLLPLIPKIYLYLQFISWLMVVVMSSFAILLWSIFWMRFNEKKDILKSAGFHYGVELLFKPLFSLISVLFAWYFFYIVAFSIGVGSELLWTISPNEMSVGYFFNVLMTLIMITMLYAIGLHYAYDLVDNINAEIMKKLGLKDIRDKQQLSDFLKAMLFDAAKDKLGSANDFLAKRGAAKKMSDLKSRAGTAGQAISRYNQSFNRASGK